jgi:hypothetical protein
MLAFNISIFCRILKFDNCKKIENFHKCRISKYDIGHNFQDYIQVTQIILDADKQTVKYPDSIQVEHK